jgi:Flp pilus assembly secretin CpaC
MAVSYCKIYEAEVSKAEYLEIVVRVQEFDWPPHVGVSLNFFPTAAENGRVVLELTDEVDDDLKEAFLKLVEGGSSFWGKVWDFLIKPWS